MKLHAFSNVTTIFALFVIRLTRSHSPNIIFMLIDDLGYNDVSFHGSEQIPTPNIDSLAYSGVILNNYYVQPLCTPSRGSLMTGKYPIKLGLQHNVIAPAQPWGLSPEEMILPQYLKQLGYATHGVGKWHLGYFRNDYLPTNRGFDSFLGYWNAKEDYFTHFEDFEGYSGYDFHEGINVAWNYIGYYGTELITDRATAIIKHHNASNPLFLYISHQAVHAANSYSPLQAPQEYIDKFWHIKDDQRRLLAGMISALDMSVGEVVSALDETGMLQNSIIVFTTDNGGAVEGLRDKSTGSNWPLRGSKYNMWEGGIKGTAFIWSPLLQHSKGHISDNLMHISDWLPTLFAAAGGDQEKLSSIDGHNHWPFSSKDAYSPRDHILHNIDPIWKVEAIRKGKHKLLRGSAFNGSFDGWFDKEGKKQENIPFEEGYLRLQKQVYARELQNCEVCDILSKEYKNNPDLNYEKYIEKAEDCSSNPEEIDCDVSDIYTNPTRPFSHYFASPVKVNCGLKPKNASFNCEPKKEACLFDIENDPCEYNNLANALPTVVQELEELLNKYRAQALPIRNQPADPAADPKYHGYAWVPWK